jgi:putative 4-mercaptohistidine N1-methyltranferase
MNIYETDKLLSEYLLFHFGTRSEIAPPAGAEHALDYAVRCVTECLDASALPDGARALDLGCAVGRSTFELARHCAGAIGIDYSRRFVEAAEVIRKEGELAYARTDEGALTTRLTARRPMDVQPERVSFEVGDAMNLREDLGSFNVVLAANLIDRLSKPAVFLARLPSLVKPGGQLVITSPYTWLEEFTPRENWLGGYEREGMRVSTVAGLRVVLEENFTLVDVKELPFLIREHARKFQFSVAQASVWRRNDDGN